MATRPKVPRPNATQPADSGSWRLSDLPATEQAELRDRLAQAKRGEDLIDFDEAMRIAKRATERILKTSDDASHLPPQT